jgi:DNA-binding transcriptional LysR family regulator
MSGDFPLVRAAAEQGLGIALLPESVCCAAISAGRLEVILPEWSPPQGVVHCVYPSRRGVLPAVRVLIDWLAAGLNPGLVTTSSLAWTTRSRRS